MQNQAKWYPLPDHRTDSYLSDDPRNRTLPQTRQVLDDPRWPEQFPFRPENFARYDETPDTYFYSQPRFVTHIDDGAIKALTK